MEKGEFPQVSKVGEVKSTLGATLVKESTPLGQYTKNGVEGLMTREGSGFGYYPSEVLDPVRRDLETHEEKTKELGLTTTEGLVKKPTSAQRYVNIIKGYIKGLVKKPTPAQRYVNIKEYTKGLGDKELMERGNSYSYYSPETLEAIRKDLREYEKKADKLGLTTTEKKDVIGLERTRFSISSKDGKGEIIEIEKLVWRGKTTNWVIVADDYQLVKFGFDFKNKKFYDRRLVTILGKSDPAVMEKLANLNSGEFGSQEIGETEPIQNELSSDAKKSESQYNPKIEAASVQEPTLLEKYIKGSWQGDERLRVWKFIYRPYTGYTTKREAPFLGQSGPQFFRSAHKGESPFINNYSIETGEVILKDLQEYEKKSSDLGLTTATERDGFEITTFSISSYSISSYRKGEILEITKEVNKKTGAINGIMITEKIKTNDEAKSGSDIKDGQNSVNNFLGREKVESEEDTPPPPYQAQEDTPSPFEKPDSVKNVLAKENVELAPPPYKKEEALPSYEASKQVSPLPSQIQDAPPSYEASQASQLPSQTQDAPIEGREQREIRQFTEDWTGYLKEKPKATVKSLQEAGFDLKEKDITDADAEKLIDQNIALRLLVELKQLKRLNAGPDSD